MGDCFGGYLIGRFSVQRFSVAVEVSESLIFNLH